MKSKISGLQWLLVIAAVLTVVLILLLPRTPQREAAVLHDHDHAEHAHDTHEGHDFLADLSIDRKEKIEGLERALNTSANTAEKLKWVDSLAFYWKLFDQPEAEVAYLRQRAELEPTEENWFVAGDLYFSNFRSAAPTEKKHTIASAIACYEKVIEINPANLAAQNAIGVCYVEGSSVLGTPPMKGIGMLLDVLKKDPENIDALVNLGYFAIQSGQYEKAIERFNTVLKINPDHSEAYLYLADIYLSMEEKEKAIAQLTEYKKFVSDQTKIDQIDNYIEEIKRNK